MTWARSFGKGRVFYTSMGHREDVWENPKYQGLLDRRPGLGHRQGRRQHRAQHQAGDTAVQSASELRRAARLSLAHPQRELSSRRRAGFAFVRFKKARSQHHYNSGAGSGLAQSRWYFTWMGRTALAGATEARRSAWPVAD